jgi:hypothetical protein
LIGLRLLYACDLDAADKGPQDISHTATGLGCIDFQFSVIGSTYVKVYPDHSGGIAGSTGFLLGGGVFARRAADFADNFRRFCHLFSLFLK